MSETDGWLERIARIRQWSRNGERAPHKPLLLLYVLGRLQRIGSTEVPYAEAEPALAQLLQDFGPPGGGHRRRMRSTTFKPMVSGLLSLPEADPREAVRLSCGTLEPSVALCPSWK